MVEYLTFNQRVPGSSPGRRTIFGVGEPKGRRKPLLFSVNVKKKDQVHLEFYGYGLVTARCHYYSGFLFLCKDYFGQNIETSQPGNFSSTLEC